MDYSKQKLKSRLNVKFEPISGHRYSVKKLQTIEKKQLIKQGSFQRNHSISQVRLPSLEKKIKKQKLDKSQTKEQLQKSIQIRQKIKSMKQIPKIKVQSKTPIHDTITYLIKSQILSIPKIVGLLQKTHSDQFLYMKIVGMYQYEVCDEDEKGASYITVSKNGMVKNGQLIPLETLVREFEIYKKLKKIQFFEQFSVIKCLDRWYRGSKKARYKNHTKKLSKLLNLDDKSLIIWRLQTMQEISINQKGGWIRQGWIKNLSNSIIQVKANMKEKLAQIIFRMLEPFELPISQSTQLMGRVLGNISGLNMSFEKKIRIQRQIQKFYRFGRQTELMFIHVIGFFIYHHIERIIQKVHETNQAYYSTILLPLEELNVQDDKYARERQSILVNSPASFDIDFKLYIDPVDQILNVRPSPTDVYRSIISQIKEFIREMEKMNFLLVRTQEFNFVIKNVFKSDLEEEDERNILRNFTYSISGYLPATKRLQELMTQIEDITLIRRVSLLKPFLITYYQYFETEVKEFPCVFQQIEQEQVKINKSRQFCDKLHDGQYFMFGYINISDVKKQILKTIKQYETKFHSYVPILVQSTKSTLKQSLNKHLSVLQKSVDDPLSFIIASEEVELLEQIMSDYTFTYDQLQKIKEYCNNQLKLKIKAPQEQKKILNEIRVKMRNFKEIRQNSSIKYRKQLQIRRITITKNVKSFETKNDEFFELSKNPTLVYEKILKIKEDLDNLERELKTLNELQSYFAMRLTIISQLQMSIVEYDTFETVWQVYHVLYKNNNELSSKTVKKIDQADYRKDYEGYLRKVQKFLKVSQLQEITKYLHQNVIIFISCLEIIQEINSPHMRVQDLQEINFLIQRQKQLESGTIKSQQITFHKLIQNKIYELKTQISEISFKARKQIQILQSIVGFQKWWKILRLQSQPLNDYPSVTIFGENQKIRRQIQQYSILLLNILNHKYGSFVRGQCNRLLKNMNTLTKTLQLLILHQQKFLNLYPILTSKYAETQLSSQFKKFEAILTKTMKNIRVLVKPTQNLNETSRSLLVGHIKSFDSMSKVLGLFLQKKRIKFQRFYFLQDDELLQVLVGIAGQSNIFRMFDGVKGWLQNKEGIKVGVKGVGGQELVLRGWMYKNTEPQVIFKSLEESITTNLNSIVRNILYNYEIQLKQLKELYQAVPWMCIYTVEMILFTKQIQINCFQNQIKLQTQQNLIRQSIQQTKNKPAQSANYITLMLFLLHFTEELRRQEVSSVFDFRWNSFLRYYFDNNNVKMRALGGQHLWGGQYQGLWQLMINTSDIRRAHACVLSNLKHGNGVLLQGPSGTGKTQSLKQLARTMGKYCVLFNCSQDVNIRTLQKLLSGLCYTASWLCLDEINRLTLEIMSVAANQITSIKNAVVMEKQKFNFMGKQIVLNVGVGIFATMNPVYLKRAKLTQNLKSYFRIITVSIPDYEKILEVMLYGLGFSKPDFLAHKIGKLFQAMSVQLNPYPQYDFGLRAMKFLVYNLKQSQLKGYGQNQSLVDAFNQVFKSRLDSEDVDMFKKIISDAFEASNQASDKVQSIKQKLQTMLKSPQTGLIVFGPTSTKSTLIKKYCESFKDPNVKKFNPASINLNYFMGQTIHGRWQYGIVEKSARDSISNLNTKTILILDSVLKSEIIENFNTLLDESKLLTLSNGTRLKIRQNFNIIMQTPHLSQTSPATITRCNLIYVCQNDLRKQELIRQELPKGLVQKIAYKRIQKYLEKYQIGEIRQISKIYKLILSQKLLNFNEQWHQNQLLGLEKALIFAIRLLNLEERIKQLMHKDNSFSIKKSVNHYMLSYKRFTQGQFLQLSKNYEKVTDYQRLYVKTQEMRFYEWVNKKAILSGNVSLLWTGPKMNGKTLANYISLKEFKYLKIPLSKSISSQSLIRCFQSKVFSKNQTIEERNTKSIIYVENLNMGNEQTSEVMRYMLENKKYFDIKSQQTSMVPPLILIADKSYTPQDNQRLERHFAKIKSPQIQNYQVKNLFIQIMKTNIVGSKAISTFKASVELQLQKIGVYIENFIERKNTILVLNKEQPLPMFEFSKIFKRISSFNQRNGKEVQDFVRFIFYELKENQRYSKRNETQELIQAYFQIFKGKYQNQYEKTLKKQAIYTTYLTGVNQMVENYDNLKNKVTQAMLGEHYYISDFIVKETIKVIKVLQEKQGYYCLVGDGGSGKKTIFKIACKLLYIKCNEYSPMNEKDIPKYYFQTMRRAFEQKRVQCIVINLNNSKSAQLLNVIEKVISGYPASQIFSSDQTDYAFSSISDYLDVPYDKTSKTYDEICEDYMKFASPYVKILLSVNNNKQVLYLQDMHYIKKQLVINQMEEYPTESIMQVSDMIMEKKLKISERSSLALSKIPNLMLKVYHSLMKLMKENRKEGEHHFKYNSLIHYKLINVFCEHYVKAHDRIKTSEDVMNRSIYKIHETNKILNQLKEKIVQMQPQVKIKKQKILQVVPILEEKKKVSKDIKYAVMEEQKEIQYKRQQVQLLMSDVQEQLKKAQPLLNEAYQSMSTIKRSQLSEMKNNMNPNPLVKFTMENIAILLGQSQSWQSVKKVIGDTNLMMKMKSCSPSYDSYMKAKKRIQENPQWNYQSVSKVAYSTRYLCKWIIRLVKFSDMKQEMDKQKKLAQELQKDLDLSEEKAKVKKFQLIQRQRAVQLIQKQYQENKDQLNRLQELLSNNVIRLENAEKIRSSLQDSIGKWSKKLQYYKQIKVGLQSYTVQLSLYLNIYPILTSQQQNQISQNTKKIIYNLGLPTLKNLNLISDIKDFYLSKDTIKNISHQDSFNPKVIQFLFHFNKTLLLDPDNQAIKWLQKYKPSQVVIVKDTFSNATKNVQKAMKSGSILMVLIDDELNKFTQQVIRCTNVEKGGKSRNIVEYNKVSIELNSNFQLILSTNMKKPNVQTKLYEEYQVINFEITQMSLKENLLRELLKVQNFDMYSQKLNLQVNQKQIQADLNKIQQKIIQSLINNKKNLVDDRQFISLLNESKIKSSYIQENSQQQNKQIQAVNKYLKTFESLCEEAANIYITLKIMNKISPLFNWDIQIFIQYFTQSCIASISSALIDDDDDEEQIYIPNEKMIGNFEFNYNAPNVSRPTSALSSVSMVTSRVATQQDIQQKLQEDFDMKGNFSKIIAGKQMVINEMMRGKMDMQRYNKVIMNLLNYIKPTFNKDERKIFGLLLALSHEKKEDVKILLSMTSNKKRTLKTLIEGNQVTQNIKNYFSSIEGNYEAYAQRVLSDKEIFIKYNEQFQLIDLLILSKIVQPQKFNSLLLQAIKNKGYESILNYNSSQPADWLSNSDCSHPIMLVMGEDPISSLTEYFNKKRYKNVIIIAMGQGQSRVAQAVLEKQYTKESIVILHNLHISQSFLPFLTKTLQQFSYKKLHKNFRLILITNMFQGFPTQITSVCHKYIIQQPPGIRNRMKYLYSRSQTIINYSLPDQRKVAYSLCLLHSIINEMLKYKPFGWNLNYDFNTSDFLNALLALKQTTSGITNMKKYECNIDMEQLQEIVKESKIDFNGLKYLIGQISYIGKMADDIDKRKMKKIIDRHLQPQILQKNFRFSFLRNLKIPQSGYSSDMHYSISEIPTDDATIYGLHENIKPVDENPSFMLQNLQYLFSYFVNEQENKVEEYPQMIKPINHKLNFINNEIQKYNKGSKERKHSIFLKEITSTTKIFNLRAFSNPKQLFIQIKMQVALKFNVSYEKVQLNWSLYPKETAYGLCNLKLEGAGISNGNLIQKQEQQPVTLYVSGSVKKKIKEVKRQIMIPLYLNEVRSGDISSFGENTNLLAKVKLQNKESEDSWLMRGTAFIVL